jgi:hypothetical protein
MARADFCPVSELIATTWQATTFHAHAFDARQPRGN